MELADISFRVFFLVAITIIGYLAGKRFTINPRDISVLLVYVISPAVIIVSVLDSPEGSRYLAFTLGGFVVCSTLAILSYLAGSILCSDSKKNLFAAAGGTGNTGYFGLPIAFGVFGDVGGAIAVFIIIGVNLYEFSVGYYLTSLGNASVRQSLLKMLRLPTIYAFALALFIKQFTDFHSEALMSSLDSFKGAYSVLGMMVIGITLSKYRTFEFDAKYLVASLSWKFLAWPAACLLLVTAFEMHLTMTERAIIVLMSAVPMAGNTVVIANELDVHPEKAATAVMASTLLALITVPLALSLL